jgi:hypothetical protein
MLRLITYPAALCSDRRRIFRLMHTWNRLLYGVLCGSVLRAERADHQLCVTQTSFDMDPSRSADQRSCQAVTWMSQDEMRSWLIVSDVRGWVHASNLLAGRPGSVQWPGACCLIISHLAGWRRQLMFSTSESLSLSARAMTDTLPFR